MSDEPHEFHRRVTNAFTRALDTAPSEQDAFVASVRREDPDVAVELQRWLAVRGRAVDGSGGRFLEEPIVRLSTLQAAAVSQPSRDASPAIGSYRVIRTLGRGAFAEVFLGEQRSPVQRRVAIKVLKVGMAPPDVLRRFERERQALARLQHPSIARLFDVGLHEGSPYFVMEWIDGRPLTAFAHERQLGAAERLALMRQLARAVQYAHEQGLVHRDLKPSNVLAFDGPDGPTVAIIDFGVAKALSADPLPGADDATLNTALGVIIGTPPYMSPELLDGDPSAASTRSDVYALGAILFELMTGERLVAAASTALAEVRRSAHAGPSRTLERLTAGVACRLPASRTWRRDLAAIVETASAPERSRRYASAGEFADDLDRLASGDAIRARRAGGWESAYRWARRHPMLVVAAAGVAVAVVGGAVILNQRVQNAELRARLLATAIAAVTSAERLADRVGVDEERARLNETTLLAARELTRLTPDDPVALDLLARGLQGAQGSRFAQSDLVTGEARARLRAASYAMRRELLAVRERIAAQPGASVADRAAVGTALVLIGNGHQAEGRVDLAEPLYRQTLEIEESLLAEAPDDPLLLSRLSYSCERLCVLATERHDDDEAIRFAIRRLDLAERLESLDPTDRYTALNVAEARRFVLAMPDTDPFNDATRDRYDEICARHVAFCRTLIDRFPGCKRSVRELAMALATAARRLPGSEHTATRLAYFTEAATLMRRVLADQPDDQILLDPYAAILSDLSQHAEWSGDVPTALERLDEQIAILHELRSRRPDDQVYVVAMARAEARRRQLEAESAKR
ncbi:MAG: serine/threonine protein kinase [Phycisphaerae bacterium]|nr:serine/threonine protein kinase [Phycisphaerae bacterium]